VGDRLDEVREARAGDFVFISPHLVHWEQNASDTEPVEMVVAGSTQEAIVVNIEDHPHALSTPVEVCDHEPTTRCRPGFGSMSLADRDGRH
jgi:uncharacterized RmlC-like cupin family protein